MNAPQNLREAEVFGHEAPSLLWTLAREEHTI